MYHDKRKKTPTEGERKTFSLPQQDRERLLGSLERTTYLLRKKVTTFDFNLIFPLMSNTNAHYFAFTVYH